MNARSRNYGYALQEESVARKLRILHLLVERSADVNAPRGKYAYPLQVAALVEDLVPLQVLLEKDAGANV